MVQGDEGRVSCNPPSMRGDCRGLSPDQTKERKVNVMGLELRCVVEAQCSEPTFSSVFTQLDEMLEEDKYELAIITQAWYKKTGKYRSWADFIFSEIFPQWKDDCMKFYADKGPAIEDCPNVTDEMIEAWDDFLCKCVELAYQRATQRKGMNWYRFALECHKIKPQNLTYKTQLTIDNRMEVFIK